MQVQAITFRLQGHLDHGYIARVLKGRVAKHSCIHGTKDSAPPMCPTHVHMAYVQYNTHFRYTYAMTFWRMPLYYI